MKTLFLAALVLLAVAGNADAQFLESFEGIELPVDPSGIDGWSFFTGDGEATMEFIAAGEGHASILVDATRDRRNIWWALIKRQVSESIDVGQLARPGWELRVEARIRSSHAPRRVNLHVNTQRTTDFHSHLMEFDIDEAGKWHTISMTTRNFPGRSDDTVNAQMALMDWGLGRYRVDVDYFKVDVVEAKTAGPDLGEPLPYHPPIPDPNTFEHAVRATECAVIDVENPELNLSEWSVLEDGRRRLLLPVGGPRWVVLRWNREAFEGLGSAGHGLLELTTHSVQRNTVGTKDFGLVRVVEILAGDPSWTRDSVTAASLLQGKDPEAVFNPQMIIDWPVTEGEGARTWFTISRPVLQRLIDGRTLGLAVKSLGAINASFFVADGQAPRLLFNIEE